MKTLIILATLALPLLASPQSADRGFCAIELEVTIQDGSPVTAAQAELIDSRGTVVKTTAIENGKGSFCDFGFGVYSIQVNHQFLLPAKVYGVSLVYGRPQHLRIVLNPPSRLPDEASGGNACRAYIRFSSLRGEQIPGVKVTLPSGVEVDSADAFGRVRILVALKEFTEFHFEKSGFRPESLSLSCGAAADSIERTVYMIPKN